MRILRMSSIFVVLALTLSNASAMADPPSDQNPNTSVFTFHCTRGTENLSFQAIGIAQSAAIAGQQLDGNGVVVFTHIEVDGMVVFDIPGQSGRSDLWTCTIEEVPGATTDVLLTPRG